MKIGIRNIALMVSFLALIAAAPAAHAQVVLYDESVSGDVGSETNPEDLGSLAVGSYRIIGSVCAGGACGATDFVDAYCFEIPAGLQLISGQVNITNLVGVEGFTQIREWDSACSGLLGTPEFLELDTNGVHSLTQVPYAGGTRYGPTMAFHQGALTGDSYDYEWTFVVDAVPVELMRFTIE